jgi:hypothetical protein
MIVHISDRTAMALRLREALPADACQFKNCGVRCNSTMQINTTFALIYKSESDIPNELQII